MKQTYIARVGPCPEGGYDIEFPDLPGTHAQAEAMEDILPEAEDALAVFLAAAWQVKIPVAPPSAIEAMTFAKGEMAVPVAVDLEAYLRRQDERTIKKTVSLPAWMAESADHAGLSLSRVLQESLKDRLGTY
jgi:predicted RNase H-like HicB family nuclease